VCRFSPIAALGFSQCVFVIKLKSVPICVIYICIFSEHVVFARCCIVQRLQMYTTLSVAFIIVCRKPVSKTGDNYKYVFCKTSTEYNNYTSNWTYHIRGKNTTTSHVFGFFNTQEWRHNYITHKYDMYLPSAVLYTSVLYIYIY